MMRNLTLGLLLGTLVTLTACAKSGIGSQPTNNTNFDVTHLFDDENVSVYRFADNGDYHYYVVPRTGSRALASTESTHACGKNCTFLEQIPTLR